MLNTVVFAMHSYLVEAMRKEQKLEALSTTGNLDLYNCLGSVDDGGCISFFIRDYYAASKMVG